MILGLLKPDGGTIMVNGERIETMSERDLMKVRADLGMVFQEGALFDSLTVAENVGYKLYEETDLPLDQIRSVESTGIVRLNDFFDGVRQNSRSGIGGAWRSRVQWRPAGHPLYDEATTGLDRRRLRSTGIVSCANLEGVRPHRDPSAARRFFVAEPSDSDPSGFLIERAAPSRRS